MAILDPDFFSVMSKAQPKLLDQIPLPLNIILSTPKVGEAFTKISNVYCNLRTCKRRIDWKDPVYRCAYVFRFFPKHSHLVYSALLQNRCHFESSWRHKNDINVCSIGGGPGSDIAGVMAFLSSINICSSLQCSVLDIFPEWESSWRAIEPHVPSKIRRTSLTYRKFDLLQEPPFSDEVADILGRSDLVTFVKSFSTVSTKSVVYSAVLPNLVNALKPGAFVLFIDNSSNQNKNDAFKELFQRTGFNVVHESVNNKRLPLPNDEMLIEVVKPMRKCKVKIYLLHKSPVALVVPLLFSPSALKDWSNETYTQTSTNLIIPKPNDYVVDKRLATKLKNCVKICKHGLTLIPERRRLEFVLWSDINFRKLRLRGRQPVGSTSYKPILWKLGIRREFREARSRQRKLRVRPAITAMAVIDVLGLLLTDLTPRI